jgi:uncharacterized membrane protein
MTQTLAFLLCLGAGTIGGVFYGFSTFVMKALGQVPPDQGARAMQRINVVVLNPLFLGVFMGTALVGVGAAIVGSLSTAPWLVAGGLLYVLGTFGVTMACNVPRNNRLAAMNADAPETAGYWRTYLKEWTFWNHVRTAAALAAAACAFVA